MVQRVVEGEKAQRAEAAKQLQATERRLAAVRNPSWWPTGPGTDSHGQPTEQGLLHRKATLQVGRGGWGGLGKGRAGAPWGRGGCTGRPRGR